MNHAETWDGMGRPWMVTVVGSSVLGDVFKKCWDN
jgi:hypothetical protein